MSEKKTVLAGAEKSSDKEEARMRKLVEENSKIPFVSGGEKDTMKNWELAGGSSEK